MNPLDNSKKNLVFISGALTCFVFLFLFSIPVASAITWNIDHTTVISNSTEFWITSIGSLGDVNTSHFIDGAFTLSINTSWLDSFGGGIWLVLDGSNANQDINISPYNLDVNNITTYGEFLQGNYSIHTLSTDGKTIDDAFCIEMPSPDGSKHCKLVIQPGGSGQASIIRRSFAITNDAVCTGENATNMQCYADIGSFTWNIDFNTSISGADLAVLDDFEVIGEIWLRNTAGQSRFFTRILDLGDELHENIFYNDANLSIVGGALNINDTINQTLVINLDRTETILPVKSDSITLNTGTDLNPAINHITYQGIDNPILTIDTSEPSVPHAEIAVVYVGANTNNIYLFENTISHNEKFIDQVYDTFADLGAIYKTRLNQLVSSTQLNISGGVVRIRMHEHTYTNDLVSTEGFFYINNVGEFIECVDNTCLTDYADDSSISNNKYYSLVWGVVPVGGDNQRLMVILQGDPGAGREYKTAIKAEEDSFSQVNFFPSNTDFKGAFIPVARTIHKRTGNNDFVVFPTNGELFQDLRGKATVASGGVPSPPITDHDMLDNLGFNVSGHIGFFATSGETPMQGNTNSTEFNSTYDWVNANVISTPIITSPTGTINYGATNLNGSGDITATRLLVGTSENDIITSSGGVSIFTDRLIRLRVSEEDEVVWNGTTFYQDTFSGLADLGKVGNLWDTLYINRILVEGVTTEFIKLDGTALTIGSANSVVFEVDDDTSVTFDGSNLYSDDLSVGLGSIINPWSSLHINTIANIGGTTNIGGQTTITGVPTSTAYNGATLIINPSTGMAVNNLLQSWSVGNSLVTSLDVEGDFATSGTGRFGDTVNILGRPLTDAKTVYTTTSTPGFSTLLTFPSDADDETNLHTGDIVWTNPDGIRQVAGLAFFNPGSSDFFVSDALYGFNYGFNIPNDATILGIQVKIQHNADGDSEAEDVIVRLTKDGVNGVGNNYAIVGVEWTDGIADITYGTGQTDLWGTTWTPQEIRDTDFGAYIVVKEKAGEGRDVEIHEMQIVVYYRRGTTQTRSTGIYFSDGSYRISNESDLSSDLDYVLTKEGVHMFGGRTTSYGFNSSVAEFDGDVTINGSVYTFSPTDENYTEMTRGNLLPSPSEVLDELGHLNLNNMFEKEWVTDTSYPYTKENCWEGRDCFNETDFDRPVYTNKTDPFQVGFNNRIILVELFKNMNLQDNYTTFETGVIAEEYITNTTKDKNSLQKISELLDNIPADEDLLTEEGKLSDYALFDFEHTDKGSYLMNAVTHYNRLWLIILSREVRENRERINTLEAENQLLKDRTDELCIIKPNLSWCSP